MRPRQPTGLGGCPPHLSHLTDGPRRGWGLPSPSVTCPFVATPDKQNRSSRTDPPLGALVARNRVCLGSFLALGRHRCGAGPEIRAGVATPPICRTRLEGPNFSKVAKIDPKSLGLRSPTNEIGPNFGRIRIVLLICSFWGSFFAWGRHRCGAGPVAPSATED